MTNFTYSQSFQNKKIYVKKVADLADKTVWYVDGELVRKDLDIEFTNFGQHYDFNFIPENEFWIDNEYSPGESGFFIDHMIESYKLMSKGVDYDSALYVGDSIQTSERSKSALYIQCAEIIKTKDTLALLKKIHRTLLNKKTDKIKIWVINGEIVRDIYFIDFTEGGHGYVYNFVPKDEVWVDDDLSPKEFKFVLIHELYERYLMSLGNDYDSSHEKSSALELKYRKNPAGINKKYMEVLKLNQNK